MQAGPGLPNTISIITAAIPSGVPSQVRAALLLCGAIACAHFPPPAERPAWHAAPPLTHARSAHAVVVVGDAIYAIGGTGAEGKPVMEVERFDGSAWRDETTLPGDGLNAPAAAAIGSRIYVIGGVKTKTQPPPTDGLVYDIQNRPGGRAPPPPAPPRGDAAP